MARPWDSIDNYKRTNKKLYTVYAFMPVNGTEVYNKLEDTTYVTSSENQFVIVGTVGEMMVVDANTLAKKYTLIDGKRIDKDALASMVEVKEVNGVRHPTIKPFRIVSIPTERLWATHVPLEYKFSIKTAKGDILRVNRDGVQHGRGDFIVCSDYHGSPNLGDRWVVNGDVFPTTYNMKLFPNFVSYAHKQTIKNEVKSALRKIDTMIQ